MRETYIIMFENLVGFDNLLVTGPQRSGTRICARMIAHDLGHQYIDENDLDMDSLYLLSSFLERKQRYVIQCPCLCRYIHIFDRRDTAVILMRRDLEEIAVSQKRIGWRWEWLELARYDRTEGVIAEVKYQYWEKYQKKKIENVFEIEYENLKTHPFWVPKDLRGDFKAGQTSIVKNNPDELRDSRPTRNRGIFCYERPGRDTALLVETTRAPKELNTSGHLTWNLCDGKHTYREILQKLKEHFDDVDENQLASDMEDFIKGLVTDGFLKLETG